MKRPYLLTTLVLLGASAWLPAQDVTTGAFTGADIDEGIDLTTDDGGEFVYAINIGGTAPINVGDLVFTPDESTPGATWEAQNHIPAWEGVNDFGAAPNDMALAEVMHSIRWSGVPESVKVNLADLKPGSLYRLQLLFAEKCCQRGWDIKINGELLADEFSARALTDDASLSKGAFFSSVFVADTDVLEIDLNGADANFGDQNPILSAVTLELLQETSDDPNLVTRKSLAFGQVAAAPPTTRSFTIRNLGDNADLSLTGTSVSGPGSSHFTVGAIPTTLAPGEEATVEVTFDSMGASGLFQATIELASNDPSDPLISVDVSASVINRNGPAARYTLDDGQCR